MQLFTNLKNNLFFFLFISLFSTSVNAQVIWTDPVFPNPNALVTVYFDATQGTGGLAGCGCDVYVHTGVITSASNGDSDWKHVVTDWGVTNPNWKMTPVSGQPDVYSFNIVPNISTFYGVPSGETIQKMAFVFRNGDGSLEGKGDGGTDLFYDVFDPGFPFTVIVQNPTQNSLIKSIGETIEYHADVSEPATLSLYDNGSLLTQVTNQQSISYDINVSDAGSHTVKLVATNGTDTIIKIFDYIAPNTPVVQDLPQGMEHGINYLNDTSVILALYAPNKEYIYVIGDFNDWKLTTEHQMNITSNGNIWWLQINGLTAGEKVGFQYYVDGAITFGDPYAELILDPNNDQYIPTSTYPNMHPYPEGKTNGIVSIMQPGETPYNWQVTDFQRPEKTDLVIYELLLRDFLGKHDYNTLIDTLDYLSNMGINAIELMPINEFDGNISWGYNPVYHGAVDKYYGTRNDFKDFIDQCHLRGIAVILDVVYNHAHENSPFAKLYWDATNFRPAADNPWLNMEAPHAYNVFFDFNHESDVTKYFVDKNLRQWLTNYNIDGFRFDLSKGLTQNTGGNFDAWAYDATRIATLKHYANTIWNTSDDAYAILEHFAQDTEENELADYGFMLWSGYDIHDNYLNAAMGFSSNLTGISYKSRNWTNPLLIGYMESHDEERMAYKNKNYGNVSGDYNIKDHATSMDRIGLASAFFYTIPGPKMLWQFGELGYDYPINYCQNGTINPNCRVDPKPIKWDYFQDANRKKLYNTISDLIHLKTQYPVFKSTDFSTSLTGYTKSIHISDADMKVLVVGNFDVTAKTMSPVFPKLGLWYDYLTGDSLDVTSTMMPIDLAPGEYHVYIDQKVAAPNSTAQPSELGDIEVYPNPNDGQFIISYQLKSAADITLQFIHPSGKVIASKKIYNRSNGNYAWDFDHDLATGCYFMRLTTKDGTSIHKVFVN